MLTPSDKKHFQLLNKMTALTSKAYGRRLSLTYAHVYCTSQVA